MAIRARSASQYLSGEVLLQFWSFNPELSCGGDQPRHRFSARRVPPPTPTGYAVRVALRYSAVKRANNRASRGDFVRSPGPYVFDICAVLYLNCPSLPLHLQAVFLSSLMARSFTLNLNVQFYAAAALLQPAAAEMVTTIRTPRTAPASSLVTS